MPKKDDSSLAEISKYLASIEPFKRLPKEDLGKLAGVTREKAYKKGETVFQEGELADSVWVLRQGRIQILKYISNGRPFAIESLGAGELFGTLCRLGGNGRCYPCTAVAAESCRAFQILDRAFLDYYLKNPSVMRGVCALCSQRLKDVQNLRCIGQESVSFRLAATLLRLSTVHGLTLPFTKREISELVGATLETTFRELKVLEKQGFVSSARGKISIKKPQELQKIAHMI